MTIKPQDVKNYIISGIFMGTGLFVAMIFIFMLSSESALFAPKIHLNAEVENAQNLRSGAAVQLRGIRVGTVQNVEIIEVDRIRITAAIDARHSQWIKEDSYFSIKTQGVLGDRYLEILGGTAQSSPAKDKSNLKVKDDSPIDMFINKGEDLLVVSGRILHRLDKLLTTVDDNSLSNILENLSKTTESLSKIGEILDEAEMGEMFTRISSASQEIESTTSSIKRITEQVETGPGTLNSLIYDNSLHQDIQTLLGGAQRNRILQFFIRESIKQSDN